MLSFSSATKFLLCTEHINFVIYFTNFEVEKAGFNIRYSYTKNCVRINLTLDYNLS